MARVIWTDQGLESLEGILDYIARDSHAAAIRFAEKLFAKVERLEQFPRIGQVVPEFGREDLREMLFGSYRILYLCRDQACFVMVVIHGSRDLVRHVDPESWEDDG